jgi:hypothetical protein
MADLDEPVGLQTIRLVLVGAAEEAVLAQSLAVCVEVFPREGQSSK